MSRLGDARASIAGALDAGGIRVSSSGRFSAPCVILEADDPWSEPVRLPGRLSKWRLTAIAGKTDTLGSFEALAALIDSIDVALRPLDGCALPTWGRPLDIAIEGATYAGVMGKIQYAI